MARLGRAAPPKRGQQVHFPFSATKAEPVGPLRSHAAWMTVNKEKA